MNWDLVALRARSEIEFKIKYEVTCAAIGSMTNPFWSQKLEAYFAL
jgi:hypothetical protein